MSISSRLLKSIRESAISDQYDKEFNTEYDYALNRYTLNPMEKYALFPVWDDLVDNYGLDDSIEVYRGLNFSDEESFNNFKKDLSDGKIKIKNISSWSPSRDEAMNFAITRPCYMEFMSKEDMRLIGEQSKNHELVVGYAGVILKTTAEKGKCVDVRKADYHKESEILLPPGDYPVEVEDIRKFSDTITDPNEAMSKITPENKDQSYYKKLFQYLIHRYNPEDFNSESKKKIFDIAINFDFNRNKFFSIEVTKPSKFYDYHGISVYGIKLDTRVFPYCDQSRIKKVLSTLKKHVKSTIDEIFDVWTPESKITYFNNFREIVKLVGLEDYMNKKFRDTIGKEYQRLNSLDATREINKIKDPREKDKAIRNQADAIMRLIQSIDN